MSFKCKIALVGAFPYPVGQGSQVFLTESARVYQQLGHEVHVCVYGYGAGDDPKEFAIHRAPMVPFARQIKAGPSWAKPLLDWRMVSFLKEVVKKHEIDMIDAHNYEALLVALATGIRPIIYHAHNAMADELPHYGGFGMIGGAAGAALDKHVPRRADHVVAPHERLWDYLVSKGCEDDRVSVIPPGISPKPFRHEKVYSESPCVIYSGNLDSYQNPEMLADVMGRIGELRPNVRRIVATNDAESLPYAEVVHTPDLDALKRILEEDAVFLCPRISWSGYPIKLLDAMAAGLPVVACASSAHPVVDGETGFVVEDGNAAQMAERCAALLDDQALRRKMGAAARLGSMEIYDQRVMIEPIIEQVLP